MFRFNITIHARPSSLHLGPVVSVGGLQLQTLAVTPTSLGQPMARSFEQSEVKLNELPRMLFEPDGSFVWVAENESPTEWQVDGMLFDKDNKLITAEVKGSCPERKFDLFLSGLGWPETDLVFQLVQEAVFLDEGEFRRVARALYKASV